MESSLERSANAIIEAQYRREDTNESILRRLKEDFEIESTSEETFIRRMLKAGFKSADLFKLFIYLKSTAKEYEAELPVFFENPEVADIVPAYFCGRVDFRKLIKVIEIMSDLTTFQEPEGLLECIFKHYTPDRILAILVAMRNVDELPLFEIYGYFNTMHNIGILKPFFSHLIGVDTDYEQLAKFVARSNNENIADDFLGAVVKEKKGLEILKLIK